jgi:hypothetical protein
LNEVKVLGFKNWRFIYGKSPAIQSDSRSGREHPSQEIKKETFQLKIGMPQNSG